MLYLLGLGGGGPYIVLAACRTVKACKPIRRRRFGLADQKYRVQPTLRTGQMYGWSLGESRTLRPLESYITIDDNPT